MHNEIVVTADSTCDLSSELIEKYNIKIVPLHITMGNNTFTDGLDINGEKIFEFVKASGYLPKTSAPSVSEYMETFSPYIEQGKSVIHISIGSSFSSSYQNAGIAAQAVSSANIHIIDSENLSSGSGHVVVEIADMVNEGLEIEEIMSKIKKIIPKIDASFILGDLEYMKKGGRCSSVAVLGANILQLKACIEVVNGAMGIGKKYRGQLLDVLKKYTDDKLGQKDINYCKKRIFITSTCVDDFYPNAIKKYVESKNIFDEVIITSAGSTIVSHCGKDTLGVLFIKE